MIQTSPSFGGGASAHAETFGSGSSFTSASASGDFLFTVFGGTGQASFYPCFVAGGNHTAEEDGFFDGISVSFYGSSGSNCFGDGSGLFPSSKPLTFGVSQIVPFQIAASAFAGFPFFSVSASIGLARILVFDASGNLLPNPSYTLVSVDLPEPSALSLVGVGLISLAALSQVRRKRRDFFWRMASSSARQRAICRQPSLETNVL
jgi:hypothetical protein